MFDIAWSELGVIAVVALVVIGPKDLPKVLRTVGQWTGKARSMARDFQAGLDDMVRESELDELRKAAKQVTDLSVQNEIEKAVDPDGSLRRGLEFDPLATGDASAATAASAAAPESVDVAAVANAAEAAAKPADAAPATQPPAKDPAT